MADRSIVEAINDCLHVELERDSSVMVMGEDVGRAGGVFRATAGLRDRFGPDRCFDTPLAEAGILGTAVGLCMAGWRPVCEMQYDAFSYPCLDQLITHVGRYRWRTGGKMEFPIVVRMPYGGGVRAPELHDDSPEAFYVHTPGVKVAIPATPADAKGLLAAAIRDPDPVVIFEPKLVYRTSRGEVPEGEHVVPLGKMRVAREGSDLTIVAYGAMVRVAEQAADALGASVAIPSTPADAKGILAAAIRDPDPVVIFEPKLHYRTIKGEVPDGEHVVPLGKARLAREGDDLTLVAYGSMVAVCEAAADALDDVSVEVLDIRSLKPLDEEALLASAAKTGRVVIVQEAPRTCGFAAELAAILAEKAILDLRGPVLRVTGYDVPYPYWQIEDAYMPSVERVVAAARRLLEF